MSIVGRWSPSWLIETAITIITLVETPLAGEGQRRGNILVGETGGWLHVHTTDVKNTRTANILEDTVLENINLSNEGDSDDK